MKLLTNKRLKEMQDWYQSKGHDEGINRGFKLGQLYGEVEAHNRWIIEGYKPPDNTLQDIQRFLKEAK